MSTKRLVLATGMSVLLLAGCAGGQDPAAPRVSNPPPAAAPSSPSAASASTPADASRLLAKYGLDGKNAVEIVDHLDRLSPKERPSDLLASVRPGEIVLAQGTDKVALDLPRFYLSVAPYVGQTHECFYHSLTTCKGELAGKAVQVRLTDDATGAVLVDGTQALFDNGFVGFWLPRDLRGTLQVTADGRTGETKIGTDGRAPTCLTTVRLV